MPNLKLAQKTHDLLYYLENPGIYDNGKLYDIKPIFSGDIGRLDIISYFLNSPHCQAFFLLGAMAFEHPVHSLVVIPLHLSVWYPRVSLRGLDTRVS